MYAQHRPIKTTTGSSYFLDAATDTIGFLLKQTVVVKLFKLSTDHLTSSFLACAILLAISAPSHSTLMENLYEVNILVADQSQSVRNKALQKALLQVLVRISGSTQPARNNPVIKRAMRKSERYLQQFSYSSSEEVKIITAADGSTEEQPRVQLNALFSKPAINRLLREAGLPIWSSNRPSVLVWAVIDHPKGRSFLQQYTETTDPDMTEPDIKAGELLAEAMEARGLPLQNPQYDVQDRMLVDSSTLWQQNQARIIQASERYKADSILFGRIAKTTTGKWLGNWHYIFQGQTHTIDTEPTDLTDFISDGVAGVVSILVQRYAIDPLETADAYVLEVSGVKSFADYAKLNQHLANLEPVNAVTVQKVSGEYIYYRLEADGGLTLLEELIALGGLLEKAGIDFQPDSAADSPSTSPDDPINEETVTESASPLILPYRLIH